MDSLFKQKLLSLRTPQVAKTFADALFKDASWAKPSKPLKSQPIPRQEVFSEKVQVIESLERFAHEKAEETQSPLIRIDGGELHIKQEPGWDDLNHFTDLNSLRHNLKLEKSGLDIILDGKSPGDIKVLFVSEKFRSYEEASQELRDGFINELLMGFPVKTAELFERMISAMKLSKEEVLIYPIEGADESDYSRDVMELAAFYKPEVIVTLGAKATNKILKSNDRLSVIHGQIFNRKMKDVGSFQVVPLFHPSIIETNQNMKKTAWADMQKIMKLLKKLP